MLKVVLTSITTGVFLVIALGEAFELSDIWWWILLPVGLAKIGGTPSWTLLSSAISLTCFIAVYLIVDVKKQRKWSKMLEISGTNVLLTYLLPDIYYAIFGVKWLQEAMGNGLTGVVRSVVFSIAIVLLSVLLTKKWNIRLQL